MNEDFDDLPDRIAELGRLIQSRNPGKIGCFAHYSTGPLARHRILLCEYGRADREFNGKTFGEAYRPAHEAARQDAGEIEVASWIRNAAWNTGDPNHRCTYNFAR